MNRPGLPGVPPSVTSGVPPGGRALPEVTAMEDFPIDTGTFFVPGPVWVLETKVRGMVG
jgi:hypothetical protein